MIKLPSITELGNEIGKSIHKQLVINPKYEGMTYDQLEDILTIAVNKTFDLLQKDRAAEMAKGK